MRTFHSGSVFILVLTAFVAASCWQYQAVDMVSKSEEVAGDDTLFHHLIAPYKEQLEIEMNKEIGQLSADLVKGKPESSLGNLIGDILLSSSAGIFSKPADFAVYNYGGLRKDYMAAGGLTKGEIFELLPFDNTTVLLTLDGLTTARLLDKIAMEGGWPVAGISMTIIQGTAQNVLINNMPFDSSQYYSVVMNDYMANGGDGMDFFGGIPIEDSGITVRDLVMSYIEAQTKNNVHISSYTDQRIVVGK